MYLEDIITALDQENVSTKNQAPNNKPVRQSADKFQTSMIKIQNFSVIIFGHLIIEYWCLYAIGPTSFVFLNSYLCNTW